MITRRQFLGNASLVAAASLLAPRMALASSSPIKNIGLQLWSVKDAMKSDFEGTIAKIAAIGYKEVEFAGYFDKTPKQVRALLDKTGLTSPSSHVQFESLVGDKWKQELESAETIGQSYLVNPWIPQEKRKTLDDWKQAAAVFNEAGAISKKAGIQFAYHNHYFEFEAIEGKLPYDVLLELCDPQLVKMELDLCWIIFAGADPIKYFEKHKGRFPLVHVKDITKIPDKKAFQANPWETAGAVMTEVGGGFIDWKPIFAKADVAGIKHFIVEYEGRSDPLVAAKNSFNYLKKFR